MAVGKRKRETLPDEVEVDINAPEPPSKKELRRAKKGKPMNHKPANSDDEADPAAKEARKAASKIQAAHRALDQAFQDGDAGSEAADEDEDQIIDDAEDSEDGPAAVKADDAVEEAKRDSPGVWIGNLPWTVTKPDLLKFVTDHGRLVPSDVTRVHMPGPLAAASAQARHKKLTNRGFAYMDFKTEEARDAVIGLSESLLAGRAVLIKNSKSFEGRPAKEDRKVTDANGKPPSQRIFVGNMSFDTTEEDLRDHYSKCGQVKSVFVATFPDSGKCKGYAWVTFDELVSAEKAIRGWVELDPEDLSENEEEEENAKAAESDDEGEDEEAAAKKAAAKARKERRKKKAKPRKWFVNRLKGRELRMEYAEDATTRYIKRYGSKKKDDNAPSAAATITQPSESADGKEGRQARKNTNRPADRSRPERVEQPRPPQPPKIETNKDMAYLTGAVMEGKGKKVKF